MSKKHLIAFFILFLIAFFVGFLLFGKPQEPPLSQAPSPTPQLQPVPTFPAKAVENKQYYTFAISFSYSPPKTLPVYFLDPQENTEELPTLLAKNFGFLGTPVVSSGSKGTYFIWEKKDGSSFLVQGAFPLSLYHTTSSLPGKQITVPEEELATVAQSYFLKFLGGSLPEAKKLPSRYFFPNEKGLNPVSSLSEASLIQLNWQYTKDGYPLYSFNPTNPSISVDMNSNRQIIKLTATIFPSLTKTKDIHTIISLSRALQKLNIGEGVLTQVSAAEIKDTDREPQRRVSYSEITAANVGYYYSKNSPTLIPVYVFTGTGTDTKNKEKVTTITIVEATE